MKEGVDERVVSTEDWLCADGSIDGRSIEKDRTVDRIGATWVVDRFGDRRRSSKRENDRGFESEPVKDRLCANGIEATWVAGRSNRLRRMDAKGLKEWIGVPMPMDAKDP